MDSFGIDDSVLLELEKSLKEIELEHTLSREAPSKRPVVDSIFEDDEGDHDDDDDYHEDDYHEDSSDVASTGVLSNNITHQKPLLWDYDDSYYDDESDEDGEPEQVLSAMMNTLVAELQAEIQEQIVREIGDTGSLPDTPTNATITDDVPAAAVEGTTEMDDVVPLEDYTALNNMSVSMGESITEQVGHDTNEMSSSPLTKKTIDHTNNNQRLQSPKSAASNDRLHASLSELSIDKTEFIQILRDHIAERSASGSKLKEWDVQPIPDLEVSDNNEDFEQMLPIQPTDPDYVPVKDYSPPRRSCASHYSRRSKRNGKAQASQNNTPASTDVSTAPLKTEGTPSSSSSLPSVHQSVATNPSPGKRPRKRRTKKHLKQQRNQKKREQLEQLIFQCAIPDHQLSRDEAIRQLATSPVWKKICQMGFKPTV